MTKTILFEEPSCVICGASQRAEIARGVDTIYQTSEQEFSYVACSACGHLYLCPRPRRESAHLIYPANYGAQFSAQSGAKGIGELKRRIALARLKRVSHILRPGVRILELGCGDGQLLQSIRAAHPSAELWGADIQLAPHTREQFHAQQIFFKESFAEELEFPDGYFDLIIMTQLIEHLWAPEQVLENTRRILNPAGYMLIETPNTDGYDRAFFKTGAWGGYYFPRHLNLFNTTSLTRLLANHGFRVEEFNFLLAPVIWVYSIRAMASARHPIVRKLLSPLATINFLSLSCFSFCDVIARVAGLQTSNMQAVVRFDQANQ
ncbi:class I SAM-dependent methyltransferase [Megalodesulfovibrio paquesii]